MKNNLLKKLTVIAALSLSCAGALLGTANAHEFKVGEIEIGHPYARAMLPGAKVGGGYLKLTNSGTPDRLVSAKSDRAATVQLHEMKMDGDTMVMRELKDGIALPENSTVELKPGGYHVMFMNVSQAFKEGEMIKATLTFEKAGPVDVEFKVGAATGGAPEMKHDDHSMHRN
ncbi:MULTISPECIES: copper chaperone PCu(A)C [unclassified Rhizobium]|uniref:copper chaperone PCu(A)C n=1 Tax=unclassified Rhizobium TaxID=2613769 RepID=UPI0017810065|nr:MULTISPECIES: copper chaperone PCu(A)C [unclassified Rhizobium]MBD8688767.1 copper chaperone PCu(A)C [Rhizobium sp. CFBP 13644]MBD8694339.1 copper chaperone PCu(A)C [Rhizobium sp. CFBP 13717]